MLRIEVRAGDGGTDAHLFAGDLAHALAVFVGGNVTSDAGTLVITRGSV